MTTTTNNDNQEEVIERVRMRGKPAMRFVRLYYSKHERWVCPKCYRAMYGERLHTVLKKLVRSMPDGSPIQCHHCKKLYRFRDHRNCRTKNVNPLYQVVVTLTVHTQHAQRVITKIRRFLNTNKEPYEVNYTKVLLSREVK